MPTVPPRKRFNKYKFFPIRFYCAMANTVNCLIVRVVVIKEIYLERLSPSGKRVYSFSYYEMLQGPKGRYRLHQRRITTRAPRYSSNACTSLPTGAYAFHEITASSTVEFFLEDRQARVDNPMTFATTHMLTLACIFERHFELTLKKKQ